LVDTINPVNPEEDIWVLYPWNYPFNLLFSPLVGAIAAGNTAILKPSELAPNSAIVVEEMINSSRKQKK